MDVKQSIINVKSIEKQMKVDWTMSSDKTERERKEIICKKHSRFSSKLQMS